MVGLSNSGVTSMSYNSKLQGLLSLRKSIDQAERKIYFDAYEAAGRDQTLASKLMGISKETFCYKMIYYKRIDRLKSQGEIK